MIADMTAAKCMDVDKYRVWVTNWPASAQSQARTAAGLQCLTSDLVDLALAGKTNVLTVTNPIGSGKVLYLASIAAQAGVAATAYRYRGATIAGGTAKAAEAGAATPATIRTGGTVTSGTLEAVTFAGQADPSPPGTVRILPGESLTWAVAVAVIGKAAVSLQLWAEPWPQ